LTRIFWQNDDEFGGPFFDDLLNHDIVYPTPRVIYAFRRIADRYEITDIAWLRLDRRLGMPKSKSERQIIASGPHRLDPYFAMNNRRTFATPKGPAGIAVADAVIRGFAVSIETAQRSIVETIAFHKLVLAHSVELSAAYLDLLDGFPVKLFSDLHDEVTHFRLSADPFTNRAGETVYRREQSACEDGVALYWRMD
jgi:hypothetical protein